MAKEKITEEQLKTDFFLQFVGKTVDYCKNNKEQVQWIAIGVVLVIVALVSIGRYHDHKSKKMLLAYENANTKLAVDEFLDLYKKSKYYPFVLFKKGNILYEEKNYKGAAEAYDKIVKDYSRSPIVDFSLLNLGYAYQALKDYDNAVNVYTKMLNKYKTSPFIGDAVLNLARCLMLKKDYKQAKDLIDNYVADEPNSLMAAEAKKLLPEITRNL
ncbi:tetratricopeptide repeat protein [bacterium]|nr:tetratricopeptide repeat protein [bacterium]